MIMKCMKDKYLVVGAENSEVAEYMGNIYQSGDKVTFKGRLYNDRSMGSNCYQVSSLDTISKK